MIWGTCEWTLYRFCIALPTFQATPLIATRGRSWAATCVCLEWKQHLELWHIYCLVCNMPKSSTNSGLHQFQWAYKGWKANSCCESAIATSIEFISSRTSALPRYTLAMFGTELWVRRNKWTKAEPIRAASNNTIGTLYILSLMSCPGLGKFTADVSRLDVQRCRSSTTWLMVQHGLLGTG